MDELRKKKLNVLKKFRKDLVKFRLFFYLLDIELLHIRLQPINNVVCIRLKQYSFTEFSMNFFFRISEKNQTKLKYK